MSTEVRMSEMHEDHEQHGLSLEDAIICALGAFVIAFTCWAAFFGIFAAINYGLAQFQITLPDLAVSALNLAAKIVPVLMGLLAGVFGYRFLARLP